MRAEARARLLAAIAKARFWLDRLIPDGSRARPKSRSRALQRTRGAARLAATLPGGEPARRNANPFRPAVPEHLAAAAPVRPETM